MIGQSLSIGAAMAILALLATPASAQDTKPRKPAVSFPGQQYFGPHTSPKPKAPRPPRTAQEIKSHIRKLKEQIIDHRTRIGELNAERQELLDLRKKTKNFSYSAKEKEKLNAILNDPIPRLIFAAAMSKGEKRPDLFALDSVIEGRDALIRAKRYTIDKLREEIDQDEMELVDRFNEVILPDPEDMDPDDTLMGEDGKKTKRAAAKPPPESTAGDKAEEKPAKEEFPLIDPETLDDDRPSHPPRAEGTEVTQHAGETIPPGSEPETIASPGPATGEVAPVPPGLGNLGAATPDGPGRQASLPQGVGPIAGAEAGKPGGDGPPCLPPGKVCARFTGDIRKGCMQSMAGYYPRCRQNGQNASGSGYGACLARCEQKRMSLVFEDVLRQQTLHAAESAASESNAELIKARLAAAREGLALRTGALAAHDRRMAELRAEIDAFNDKLTARTVHTYQNQETGAIVYHRGHKFDPDPSLSLRYIKSEPGKLSEAELVALEKAKSALQSVKKNRQTDLDRISELRGEIARLEAALEMAQDSSRMAAWLEKTRASLAAPESCDLETINQAWTRCTHRCARLMPVPGAGSATPLPPGPDFSVCPSSFPHLSASAEMWKLTYPPGHPGRDGMPRQADRDAARESGG